VVNTYLNILALRPDHPAALTALASRYEAQGRYGDLVQVLTRQADAAKDAAEKIELHRRIAALWADKLGKHGNAIASFEKIFEADPTDSETSARLKDLYTKGRAWRPLIEVYRKELPHLDAATRRARLIEMARAAEQRADKQEKTADKVIDIWKGVLRLSPHLPEAVEALKRLYTRTEKWNALLELLKEALETVPAANVDDKVSRYLDIVAIDRDRLNLDVMVVNTYLSIVALKPDHPAALAALASRY